MRRPLYIFSPCLRALTLLLLISHAVHSEPDFPPIEQAQPVETRQVETQQPETQPVETRNPAWAKPIEAEGVPNFHRVDENLYRGAQPSQEGFETLEGMGIKTVINLRWLHGDRPILPAGMRYFSIPMNAWHAENEDVVAFLKVIKDPSNGPYFVHCMRGADRTGMVCAAYRMAVQGWTKSDATEEMTQGGFGFWMKWKNIRRYVRNLNVEELRATFVEIH